MKIRAVLIFILFLFPFGRVVTSNQNVLEYPVSDQQFAIVVVRVDNMSRSDAKKIALERAKQLTEEKGYKSYTVVKEQDVQVAKSNQESDQYKFYGNMYQELIIEGDFNRNRLANKDMPNASTYPAYRLVIRFNNSGQE